MHINYDDYKEYMKLEITKNNDIKEDELFLFNYIDYKIGYVSFPQKINDKELQIPLLFSLHNDELVIINNIPSKVFYNKYFFKVFHEYYTNSNIMVRKIQNSYKQFYSSFDNIDYNKDIEKLVIDTLKNDYNIKNNELFIIYDSYIDECEEITYELEFGIFLEVPVICIINDKNEFVILNSLDENYDIEYYAERMNDFQNYLIEKKNIIPIKI